MQWLTDGYGLLYQLNTVLILLLLNFWKITSQLCVDFLGLMVSGFCPHAFAGMEPDLFRANPGATSP